MTDSPHRIAITVDSGTTVSGLVQLPATAPLACYVFAHGAGAGMDHAFMRAAARGLADRGIATLRYQFAFMERGSKRPDPPALAHAVVRAAVAEAARRFPGVALFAGGKSFGGRMSSQAQAQVALPGVRGLVFVGFPLHTPDKPSTTRAEHLADVPIPMLFVQGTRDALAEFERMSAVVESLGERATLLEIAEADHAFHVLVRSGRTDAEVLVQVLDGMAAWMTGTAQAAVR